MICKYITKFSVKRKLHFIFLFIYLVVSQPAYAQVSEFKITASDGAAVDAFGYSVSISGDYAVVGAFLDDDSGSSSGSAYIFKRVGESWAQEAKLLPADGAASDKFGRSVSISGDYAVVGAFFDSDNGIASGSAYVFKRTGASWAQEAKLLPSDGATSDVFGISVSISGDYAVVGASGDDDNGSASGSAYVFKRSGTSWAQETKLLPSDAAAGDFFGKSVSISGDYAVVGAQENDDNGTNSGSAYVFKRAGASWAQETKLLPSDGATIDVFGISVSISGDYAVVGAHRDSDNGSFSGSAYVFKRTDVTWTQEAKLLPSDGAADDQFGISVSISGDYAVVGAQENDDNGSNSGSAYLFKRSDTIWTQEAKLLASDGAAADEFGRSVSISGDYAVVGAWRDNDNGTDAGSAYLYSLHDPFVANPIQDVAADEDFGSIMVALLDTVFDDLDLPNDSLRYSVSVSSGLVIATITGDTLWLFSVTDLNGIAEIVVTATDDSSASVSDSFNVTILPVGDDPSRFSLSFPLGDTLNTLQPTFRWNSAADPDIGDVIEYQISISASETMESPIYTESLSDTFHTITVPLTDDLKYYWSLSANTTTVNPKLDYQTQIEPIFTNNCTSRRCHVSGNTGGGLNLQVGTSFDEITGFATTMNAPLVIAGDPDISPLIWKLEGGVNLFGSRMPFGGPFLSESTINSIRQWITEGANPSADDSSGGFSFSDTSSFLLDKQEPPQAFSLISPADGSSIDTLRPRFSWEQSIDPDPRDEVKYTLFLFSTINEDTVIYKIQGIVDTVYQFTEDIETRDYQWFVSAVDADADSLQTESTEWFRLSVIVGIDDEVTGIPQEYELYQNYPNPFNPSTLIKYALPKSSTVSLVIYNLMGQEIMRWDENNVTPGYYEKTWNGKTEAGIPVSSGIYIYRITTAEFIQTKKMVLLK
ncbi:MAG: T9SS type A sorting domain-containing protein [Candidatus Marinimicrobia bacterium]|nr:T9SS type A sorting domain-containing protein [Candidatus Neomarinimicrobiota bacterium]